MFSSLASPKHSGGKQRNTLYNRFDGVIEIIWVIRREGTSVATETCCFLGHKLDKGGGDPTLFMLTKLIPPDLNHPV